MRQKFGSECQNLNKFYLFLLCCIVDAQCPPIQQPVLALSPILLISTIAAIVTASVALLMMNFSRSGRTVEESRAWLKRIAITWAILNGLGFIMAYVTPFFSGGQWTA